MRLRTIFLIGTPVALLAAAPFGYSLTRTASLPKLALVEADDSRKAAQRLCASRVLNDRLKAQLFNEAAAVGGGASSNLDLLASFSEVRMEQPVLKHQDDALGVTVCQGRFVVLLPPGSERGFGGMRVLGADVEYAAQPAADGSGLVYQLRGADSIVYRIAAFSLRHHTIVPRDAQMAKAAPVEDMPLAIAPAVWPDMPEPAAPPADVAEPPQPEPPKSAAPVQIAEAKLQPAPVAAPKPAVKIARTEVKAPVAKPQPKFDPVKPAQADAKPATKQKPEKVKPVALAAVKKVEPTKAEKAVKTASAKPTANVKARAEKAVPVKSAANKKAPPAKPTAKQKATVTLAAKKTPALAVKPKVQLAAASTAKSQPAPVAAPTRDLASNSFLAYEQARQRKPEPTPQPPVRPVVQKAVAPAAAPREACTGGIEARLVCANPSLASKQRTANNFYYAALEQADGEARRELTGSRNRFLAYLDRCRSVSCAADAYDDRVAEIRDIMREF